MTQTPLPDPEGDLAKKDDAGTIPGAHSADGADGADLSAAAASSDAAAVSSGGARRRPGRGWRIALLSVLAIFLVLTLATGGLALWVRHSLASGIETIADPFAGIATRAPRQSVPAGQEAATNILVLGTDSRTSASDPSQWAEGAQRTDAIMILQISGDRKTVSVMSIPRDSWVDIPGHGQGKINAAYSYGGAKLLVKTVEDLSGLTIDHYVEVGMAGVKETVDAVDGVDVCLDYDVDDPDSGLVWDTSKGTCQHVDGEKALAYSRMRKSDPTGDIGRGLRQRAVISAVVDKAVSAKTIISWPRQDKLVDAGTKVLTADNDTGLTDIGQMVLGFRSASSDGLTGAPPIDSLDYEPGGIGAAVLLKDETAPDFFSKLREGKLSSSDFNKVETSTN